MKKMSNQFINNEPIPLKHSWTGWFGQTYEGGLLAINKE